MKVYKFGGGILKDAQSIRKLCNILKLSVDEDLLLVISAIGKTTNAFEELAHFAFHNNNEVSSKFNEIRDFYFKISDELFKNNFHKIYNDINIYLNEIKQIISEEGINDFDIFYDSLIPYGELISSCIISSFLTEKGIKNTLLDARQFFKTDSNFRNAGIRLAQSGKLINKAVKFNLDKKLYITQGFIGSNAKGNSTTLGREGSDYSAAVYAYLLNAGEVIFWKDVDGIFNADPKKYSFSKKIKSLSYEDAGVLTIHGAKILHSKAITPLKIKDIPAEVRLFEIPVQPGTKISKKGVMVSSISLVASLENKALLIFSKKDIKKNNLNSLKRQLLKEPHCVRVYKYFSYELIFISDNIAENIEETINKYSEEYLIECRLPVEIFSLKNLNKQDFLKVFSGYTILYNFFEEGFHIVIVQKKY